MPHICWDERGPRVWDLCSTKYAKKAAKNLRAQKLLMKLVNHETTKLVIKIKIGTIMFPFQVQNG